MPDKKDIVAFFSSPLNRTVYKYGEKIVFANWLITVLGKPQKETRFGKRHGVGFIYLAVDTTWNKWKYQVYSIKR